ncbi:hypothetical protein [Cellulomonas soli]|uniref:Uncharacterized protein n=1 Tax=Cellulomonas soli TaxID=931535 RepID=A0A512PH60_9CELL|nr:hypothetical protein [Cellulomonas soli]NYI60881.1 hypothetical protein [Cellulomonas soli]GEP70535.1 hypothetical protein CSO01_32500 [Cellulomonas soli]
MTGTSEQDKLLLERLQRYSDRAEPPMALDSASVLRAARRRDARRRTAIPVSLVVTASIAAGLHVAAPSLVESLRSAAVDQTQQADSELTDTPIVLELAPGVRTVSLPVARRLADGSVAYVLGLTGANWSTSATEIAIVANDGANAETSQRAPWRDTSLDVALLQGDVLSQRQHWDTWASEAPLSAREREYWYPADSAPTDATNERIRLGQPTALAVDEGWAMAIPFDDGTWLIIGFAPSGIADVAEAQVMLRQPLLDEHGDTLAVLSLPTFDVGSADGRRMFAASIDPAAGLPTPVDGPTFPIERIPVTFSDPRG